ncbi:hypothetical protein SCLCIDRAFT_476799 [Scleroderma citrinum Foug A]|uniref:Uncharacterized protein n=1 Tax=Scleroderma citrinum Foug A TaxID=1036808 RepID=A0A0C3D9C9_9AGAM|nr:hypothetical protein SCLCIDRAFT_476799 [Scleroderma citrinum Foug A]
MNELAEGNITLYDFRIRQHSTLRSLKRVTRTCIEEIRIAFYEQDDFEISNGRGDLNVEMRENSCTNGLSVCAQPVDRIDERGEQLFGTNWIWTPRSTTSSPEADERRDLGLCVHGMDGVRGMHEGKMTPSLSSSHYPMYSHPLALQAP